VEIPISRCIATIESWHREHYSEYRKTETFHSPWLCARRTSRRVEDAFVDAENLVVHTRSHGTANSVSRMQLVSFPTQRRPFMRATHATVVYRYRQSCTATGKSSTHSLYRVAIAANKHETQMWLSPSHVTQCTFFLQTRALEDGTKNHIHDRHQRFPRGR